MASVAEEYPTSDALMERITSPVKMERDGGLAVLLRVVKSSDCDQGERKHLLKQLRSQVAADLTELGNKESITAGQLSEKKLGALSAALILANVDNETESENTHQFILQVKADALALIWDQDVRVRLVAGELFGLICKTLGPSIYLESRKSILDLLEIEFQRNQDLEGMIKSPETPIDPTGEMASSEPHIAPSPQLGQSPATTPTCPNFLLADVLKEATAVFGGQTAGGNMPLDVAANLGCAQLESTLKCIQFIAKGLGAQFGPLVDQHLLEFIYPALHHQNRFIRESGFFLCATLIESGVDLKTIGKQLAAEITQGLTDFCSQSRIAAAISCRKFMMNLSISDRPEFLPVMLPRLCLCRYYMADTKFLLYSQESWKVIFGNEGTQLVSANIENVVSYYLEATTSDNHAVREAACACLGELSRKIDRNIVGPYAASLLETLRRCFNDDRWHVRDAACLAAGSFFVNYPAECQGQLQFLLPLIYENLQFPISIVRQGAAAALANCVRAYGMNIIPEIIKKIAEGLTDIEKQPAETSKNADSMGMSPELKYSYPPGQGASCVPYARPSHPWELCDGCLYLIGDIAQIPDCQPQLPELVPKILNAAKFRSYLQHVIVLETLCKILPILISGIGKKEFKEYLSLFFEPIFYSIECENSLTAGAATVCLKELAQIYGPNILRSRVEMYDPRFVRYVEEH